MRYSVVYMVSTLGKTGPTNQLYELVKNIDRERFETKIVTLSDEPKNSRYADFQALNIQIIPLGLSRQAFYLRGIQKLKKIVQDLQPDIIHSSGFRADIFSAKHLRGYKRCNTAHNNAFRDYRMTYGSMIGTLMAWYHIKMLRYLNLCIACSYSTENSLKKFRQLKLEAVQNGIDENKYSALSYQERSYLRESLGLEKYRRIFIISASLCKLKDPLTIIDAFTKADLSRDTVLLVLGDGPLFDECLKMKNENVILLGRVDNASDYLKASDVFVSASLSEGLPLSVLEAMGCGLPLILSDIEPHKEILSKNIKMGDMFRVGDRDGLINLLKKYEYCHVYGKGAEARDTLEKYFTSNIMCKNYEELYMKILNDPV